MIIIGYVIAYYGVNDGHYDPNKYRETVLSRTTMVGNMACIKGR